MRRAHASCGCVPCVSRDDPPQAPIREAAPPGAVMKNGDYYSLEPLGETTFAHEIDPRKEHRRDATSGPSNSIIDKFREERRPSRQ